MIKYIGIVITGVLTSLFLFPFQFQGLPGNTKMYLAVCGLIVLGYELSRGKSATLSTKTFTLSILSIIVSLCGIVSVVLNNTPDYAYASYFMSMWVWLGAAYFIVKLMEAVHGKVDVGIICNYLIAVCVAQCIASILIDRFPNVRRIVDQYVEQGQDFLKNTPGVKRKYGIGASLDVAGSRFSAVLIMICFLIVKSNESKKTILAMIYFLAFIFISIQGNAIARTTSVGMLIGLSMLLIYSLYVMFNTSRERGHVVAIGAIIVFLITIMSAYLYNTDEQFHEDLRFGFEGFFSLAEKGEWSVSSNEKLKSMYVWPDNAKTWIIGDGYFSNPINTDPYFVGNITGGYYMGTDVGYLRFIFYFGVFGLVAFSAFMCYSAKICMESFKNNKWMFLLIIIVNFIVWFKVSTDIFVIFAPFLALSAMNDSEKDILSVKKA